MNLDEFLLARIAEDEAKVALMEREVERVRTAPIFAQADMAWLTGIDIFVSSARWRADCDAKRQIVAECGKYENAEAPYHDGGRSPLVRAVLASLALPYADHPEYRDEWRP